MVFKINTNIIGLKRSSGYGQGATNAPVSLCNCALRFSLASGGTDYTPTTNIPVECVQCDGEVYWSYNMAAHYRVCHSLIPLPAEFIIKEDEINKLKKTAKKNSKKTQAKLNPNQNNPKEVGAAKEDLNTGLIEIDD